MRLRTSWLIVIAVFLLLVSCQNKDTTPSALSPVITSFVAAKSPITKGTSTTLTAVFSNGTGNIDQGVGSVTSGQPATISPQMDTTYTLTVTGQGGTATKTTSVSVVAPPVTPVISAPEAAAPGKFCAASISEQTGCSYAWTITGGTITAGTGTARITFMADTSGNVVLSCVVTNAAGTASAPGSLTIPIGIQPPRIETISFPDMYEGCSGNIIVTAKDPHGTTLTYDFQQMAGPQIQNFSALGQHYFFVAPEVSQDELLTYKVAVTNGFGSKAEQTVSATIKYSEPWTLDLKLNPMPASVLLDPDHMTITLVAKTSNPSGKGAIIRFPDTGDFLNHLVHVFFLLSEPNGYIIKEGKDLGIENILGSTNPTVYDFNGDGTKDIFFPGFTDAPCFPVPSYMAVQQADGTFLLVPTSEKICSHNGDFVDLNGDGRPDFILTSYGGFEVGLAGLLYYENTGTGLKLHRTDTAPPTLVYLGGSSATAGDFHKTGVPTIIDADTGGLADGTGFTLKNVVEVSNLKWGVDGNLVSATQTLFMTPFFNRDPRFARAVSTGGDTKSHNICTKALDLDGDGYKDFVMASCLPTGQPTNVEPTHSIINVVRGTATGFSDETESRLWNYQVTCRETSGCLRILDLNGDGRPDLVGSGEGWCGPGDRITPRTTGNEVLLNDGTGNLVSVFWEGFDILQQKVLDMTKAEPNAIVTNAPARFFPLLGPSRELRWLTFVPYSKTDASGGAAYYLAWFLVDPGRLSTGPYMQDPAAWGVPGFSELYYLTHNPDVREMVVRGEYSSGLAHYLAQGKSEGRRIAF